MRRRRPVLDSGPDNDIFISKNGLTENKDLQV
jgi:hypothetical protein